MAELDKDILKNLTKLSRIQCSEKVFEKLLKNMKSILNYVDQLKEVDTEDVPECNHVLEAIYNVMREDKTEETLDTETFLTNSPSHVGGMIRVPPVIKF